MLDPNKIVALAEPRAGLDDAGPRWALRYWSIFLGQSISLIGSALTQFVLLWWITANIGSVSALATAGVVALLPQALLGPLGGTFADRYSRRLLMIAADVVSAVCMAMLIALFLTDRVELWHIYAMLFVRSAMQAFQTPAAAASTAMLVPRSFLPRAAGLNQTMIGIMTIAAAPLGALAISIMPIGWALGIDVATALLGIVPLLIFAIPQDKPAPAEQTTLWTEFLEGVRFVWRFPDLRLLYALLAAVVLVIMPSYTLVPLLVKEYFGGAAGDVAIMEGLGGAAMIFGGIVVATLAPRRLMLWILWGFAVSCFALALIALMPSEMFWGAVACWMISGMAFILGEAPFTTLIETSVPNQLHGRVLSLLNTIMGLAAPIGLALATPIGEVLGVRWLFVATGIAGGLISLLGFLSPSLRSLGLAVPRDRRTKA